jgi:hypothetical protein
MSEDLTQELLDTLGEDNFIRLVEEHGGTRLFIPIDSSRSKLPASIGLDNTMRLINLYARSYIKVPVAKEFRALRYREAGLSNSQVARKLGLTESSVEKIFNRARKSKPDRGKRPKDTRQLDLF